MTEKAFEAQYDSVELFGIPALFTNSRLDRTTIPSGWHCYDVRGSDHDPGRLSTLEPYVLVNHAGSILSLQPIPFPEGQDYVKIRGKINFDDDPNDMLTKFRESCRQMKAVDSANAEIDKPESIQENEGSGDSAPLRIKNLADLKRLIKPGTEIRATYHAKHPEIVGLTRVVTTVKTNCFYSKIKDQPEHKYSTMNRGMGLRSDFEKAGMYRFSGSSITALDPGSAEPKVLYVMEVFAPQMSMAEQNNTMRMEMM